MEEVTALPAVTGTVHCAVCLTGYELTPEQAAVLAGLGPVTGWRKVAERYATAAGWFLRTDGLPLCGTHRAAGNWPLAPPAH